ncbi:MAG: hypothetical protein JWM27_3152 [Gemmatimonadetes bacterium]|nr:hypothetical protein [Gemmatimonadota bacterium]
MGFTAARSLLIDALLSGRFQHEERRDLERKNLLAVGDVSAEFVIGLLKACRGNQYKASPYHFDARILCHEFKPVSAGQAWYVKAYFLSSDAVFISVHR